MIIKFLIGMQASGKSTYCKQFLKDNQDWKCVNRDSIRHMLSNYSFDNKNEQLVTLVERKAIQAILDQGYNLIVDKMNINSKYLQDDVTFIQSQYSNVEFEYMEFPVTLGEAIERDKKRDFVIGESVLKQTWKKYEIQLKEILERAKVKIEYNPDLPDAVIFDIDGTLAYAKYRRIFDEDKVDTDEVIEPVKFINNLLLYYKQEFNLNIIILSGRQDSCREKTLDWLGKNGIVWDKLYMRKAGDSRKDTIIKKELYEEYIKGKYNVKFVIDDRPAVLDTWVSLGLFTLNVNQDSLCKNNF